MKAPGGSGPTTKHQPRRRQFPVIGNQSSLCSQDGFDIAHTGALLACRLHATRFRRWRRSTTGIVSTQTLLQQPRQGPSCGSGGRRRTSPAFAPSPMAMTICLYGTVVASPAANTPGTEVCAARVDHDLAARRQRPPCPSATRCWAPGRSARTRPRVRGVRSRRSRGPCRRRPVTFSPSPMTSVVCALEMTVTLGRLRELALQHGVGAQLAVELDQRHVRRRRRPGRSPPRRRSCRRRSPPRACP